MNLLSQIHPCPLLLKGTLFGYKSLYWDMQWNFWDSKHTFQWCNFVEQFVLWMFQRSWARQPTSTHDLYGNSYRKLSLQKWGKKKKKTVKNLSVLSQNIIWHTILKQVLQITKFKCTTYLLWQPLPGRCWIFRANSVHPLLHIFSALL